ncbi:hypothetical protein SEPCBS57363_002645 [Sporothrix epigloea]|uniref:Uncharacterized protein n=1 Tax=Sporothrix epigloea TaxID=1892477 RepID=A0ABP0DID2_9PEZI
MAAISVDDAQRMSDVLDGQASLNASRHAAGQETLAAPAQGDTVAITDKLSKKLIASGIQQLAAPGKANDLLRLCRDVLASLQPISLTKADLAAIVLDARPQCFPDPIDPEPFEPTITNQTKPTAAPDDDEYTIVEGRKRRALKAPRRGRPPKAVQEPRRLTFPQDEATAMDLTTDNNTIEKFFGRSSTITEAIASAGTPDSQCAGVLPPST